jgi:hypothetical protein
MIAFSLSHKGHEIDSIFVRDLALAFAKHYKRIEREELGKTTGAHPTGIFLASCDSINFLPIISNPRPAPVCRDFLITKNTKHRKMAAKRKNKKKQFGHIRLIYVVADDRNISLLLPLQYGCFWRRQTRQ